MDSDHNLRCYGNVCSVGCTCAWGVVQVAKDNEVMVAISNANYAQPGGMLDLWMDGVRRSNVTNALVIALDDATQRHVESLGFTAYQMSLQVHFNPAMELLCKQKAIWCCYPDVCAFCRCMGAARMPKIHSMITSPALHVQISEAQKGVGSNHAVSGLKFRVLRPLLDLGYAVLLSDVDIITLQNPFNFLQRDCDVEGMSDGWDNATAYGQSLVV